MPSRPHLLARAFAYFLIACLPISALVATADARSSVQPQGAAVEGAHGLNGELVGVLWRVAKHFNRPVIVSSGCRTSHGNRRAGGAKRSYHLRCLAADIKVSGISETQVLRVARQFNRKGGIGTYCRNTVVHIDLGPKREWHQGCGSRNRKLRDRTIAALRQ